MKKEYWSVPLVVTLILTIVIPLVVLLSSIFQQWKPFGMFEFAVTLILLITSGFILLYNILEVKIKSVDKSNETITNSINHLTNAMNSTNRVYAVNKYELYETMSDFLLNSKSRVDLMYLGRKPPTQYPVFTQKETYIDNLKNRITVNDKPIRRIILYTDANKSWIKELADTYNSKNNVSLYILNNQKLDAISVQIFDDKRVILMNVDNTVASIDKRDVIVESIELNSIFEFYYNRIIIDKTAIPIIENGKKNNDNYQEYLL
jgi:hypothetical protein